MTSAAGIVPLPRSPPSTPSVITTMTFTCTQFLPSRYHPPTSGGRGAREPSTKGVGGAREGQAPPIDPFEANRRCPCNPELKRKVSKRQGKIHRRSLIEAAQITSRLICTFDGQPQATTGDYRQPLNTSNHRQPQAGTGSQLNVLNMYMYICLNVYRCLRFPPRHSRQAN